MARKRTCLRSCGRRLRSVSKARKPRSAFLDGSRRSTRTISLGLPARSSRSESSFVRLATSGPRANLARASGSMEIGYARTQIVRPRQRTCRPAGSTRASRTKASIVSQEVARVAVGLQAADVVGQQPLADRAPQRLRQHQPRIDRRPRDVVEMQHQRLGALLRGRTARRGRGGSPAASRPAARRCVHSSRIASAKASLTVR